MNIPTSEDFRAEYKKLHEFDKPWHQRFNAIFNEVLTEKARTILCKILASEYQGFAGYKKPDPNACEFQLFAPNIRSFIVIPDEPQASEAFWQMLTLKTRVTQPRAFPNGSCAILTVNGDIHNPIWKFLQEDNGPVQTEALERLRELQISYLHDVRQALGASSAILRKKNKEDGRSLEELREQFESPLMKAKDDAYDAVNAQIPKIIPEPILKKLCMGFLRKSLRNLIFSHNEKDLQQAVKKFRIHTSCDSARCERDTDWWGESLEITPENLDQMYQLQWQENNNTNIRYFRAEYLLKEHGINMSRFIPVLSRYEEAFGRLSRGY